jgi:hypothetical protein
MVWRKKGLTKELGHEDMKDYIRREMAAAFVARERWPELSSIRQGEVGLEHGDKTREQATANEALHDNREMKTDEHGESGRGIIKEMSVILL